MIAFLIAAALAGQSTTTCRTVGTTVQCDTQPNATPTVDYGLLTRNQPSAADSYQQGYALGQALRQRREQEQKSAVGRFLAAGDCARAERYALEKGNIDLAAQVKAYCAK